ncbi:hypothetical protein [Thiohalophilus sp.]|uniref:hypothetical protein n=1 Tax=Thiohalophilus sp. TaxID=3028392 RepID=UPI002ACE8290|nr:hypothetical protein [Thiohalophilus sp.]MDZ7804311.1 hypothetical protein [Thiohalophilus sp.]
MTDSHSAIDDVYRLAEQLGLVVEHLELDGTWHRVPVTGKKKSNLSGAYCLSELTLRSGRSACGWHAVQLDHAN